MRIGLLLVVLLAATPVFAQVTLPGVDDGVRITISPAHPNPETRATVQVGGAFYTLDSSLITWSVNGKVVAKGEGLTSTSIEVGPSGTEMIIVADITAPEGNTSAELFLTPVAVDLLWEADTYTPPFFKGRALPSSGSLVTVVALPHLRYPGEKSEVPVTDIVFTWRKDGQVLQALSGRGKNSVRIESPLLYGTATVSVEATTLDGSLTATRSLRIDDRSPQLLLYKDHPLFGILWHDAVSNNAFLPEVEMSFAAIPYFAPVRSVKSGELDYEWRVNQGTIPASPSNPNEITLNAASSTGFAHIALTLGHRSNFFFGVDNEWDVTLNSRSSGIFGFDPFRAQ